MPAVSVTITTLCCGSPFVLAFFLLLPPHAANPMVKATAANPRPKNFACFTFRKAPYYFIYYFIRIYAIEIYFEPNETLCPFF